MQANIRKLYLSNFLIGLIFWYGIEKLFQQSVGITAIGMGIITTAEVTINLIGNVPAGVLADRWSRKGVLFISTIAMGAASLVMGFSDGFTQYLIGYMLYAVYTICTDGTYNALIYDVLHEKGESRQYSRVAGRAYALFLAGAGAANIFSGFIADSFSYRTTYFISVIPCVLNGLIILSIYEPTFHKKELKEKVLSQLRTTTKIIINTRLLRALAIIMSTLTIVELYKSDFGQLYFLRYVSTPQLLGLIWSAYAFTWAIGSLIAHRFHARLNALIWTSTLPMIMMSFIDHWISLVLFMIQAVASAALFNQVETRIQDATPSSVRASVLSLLDAFGLGISIPASLAFGYFIDRNDAFWTLRLTTFVAAAALIYWLIVKRKLQRLSEA